MTHCFLYEKSLMNIYVGNLPYNVRDEDLQSMFAAHGEVSSARVIMDRESGRSKGFGFVEMPNSDEAQAAIDALNDTDAGGRSLRVNEARPREDRPRRAF
jgi:RNA recognition motif-containing protein